MDLFDLLAELKSLQFILRLEFSLLLLLLILLLLFIVINYDKLLLFLLFELEIALFTQEIADIF